jgi:hypothetical protein
MADHVMLLSIRQRLKSTGYIAEISCQIPDMQRYRVKKRIRIDGQLSKSHSVTASCFQKALGLLIPAQERDYIQGSGQPTRCGRGRLAAVWWPVAGLNRNKRKHWVVCLSTSCHYGPKISPPDVIIGNIKFAVEDLKRQLTELQNDAEIGVNSASDGIKGREVPSWEDGPGELWSSKFNSGLFIVDWEKSRKALEDSDLKVTVVRALTESGWWATYLIKPAPHSLSRIPCPNLIILWQRLGVDPLFSCV